LRKTKKKNFLSTLLAMLFEVEKGVWWRFNYIGTPNSTRMTANAACGLLKGGELPEINMRII
jgi:hypothetical protein